MKKIIRFTICVLLLTSLVSIESHASVAEKIRNAEAMNQGLPLTPEAFEIIQRAKKTPEILSEYQYVATQARLASNDPRLPKAFLDKKNVGEVTDQIIQELKAGNFEAQLLAAAAQPGPQAGARSRVKPKLQIDPGLEAVPAPAVEPVQPTTAVIDPKSLQAVEEYMDQLLSQTSPRQVLLVLDVDGTLTNYSMPGEHETQARGNAVEFVTKMVDRGVNVVISSAWDQFDETLERLRDLGLSEKLRISQKTCFSGIPIQVGALTFEGSECHTGLVSSVQDPVVDRRYYREKAYAYSYVYPNLESALITHVVFADDSSGNVQQFLSDLQRAGIFKNAQVKTFTLSAVRGGITF